MSLPFHALERVDRGGVFLLVAFARAALTFVGTVFLCGFVFLAFLVGGALLESLSVVVEGLLVVALAFFLDSLVSLGLQVFGWGLSDW